MAKVSRFEELIAWQKARALTREIYSVSRDGEFARDFGLKDQMRRSAVSVMSNIAEGFERHTPADYHRFLIIAKASCGELRSQIYIAKDVGYLEEGKFKQLMRDAIETSKVIGGLAAAIKRTI